MEQTLEHIIEATDGRARAGKVKLPRGEFETPIFMPVGTQATVKAMRPSDLRDAGASVILSNAYHLFLRPGHATVEELGGLHKFMNWDRLILTDSGGYQVFSLKSIVKISDEGVRFKSHIDGAEHFITPEENMRIQRAIGADMVMAFDQCPPGDADHATILEAVDRTSAWIRRCKTVPLKPHQTLIPIVQGGCVPELRKRSAEDIASLGFPAYAIGGLSVGEERAKMLEAVSFTEPLLPRNAPRYLMGVGMPEDILDCIELGIDMFDCVLPTRMARNAAAFTSLGRLNLRNARFAKDDSPLDPACGCQTCRNFSRAYLRHLFVAGEILAPMLTTFHNISFYVTIAANARRAILSGSFRAFKTDFLSAYHSEVKVNQNG